jgi:hypothetical protein
MQTARRKEEEAANYIAAMAKDLSAIAQRSGLDTLGYLLDIVRLEAQRVTGSGLTQD